MEKIIGKNRFIGATNDNLFTNVTFEKTTNLYKEENNINDISEYDIFLNERNSCNNVLLYGKMELLFDDSITFTKDEWSLEVGYVTYSFDESSSVSFTYNNVGEIILPIDYDIDYNEMVVFNKGDDIIYTKVVSFEVKSNYNLVILDTLKDLRGYKLYIKNYKFYKLFNKISEIPYYKSGFSTNIYGDTMYQFSNEDDIDISKFKGMFKEQTNELCYNVKYTGSTYLIKYKFPENIISKNTFNINEMEDIVDANNYFWLSRTTRSLGNLDVNDRGVVTTQVNESGRVTNRDVRYVAPTRTNSRSIRDENSGVRTDTTTTTGGSRVNPNPNTPTRSGSRSGVSSRNNPAYPERPEGEGSEEPYRGAVMYFMYNYRLFNIKELGDVLDGIIYSDTVLPDHAFIFNDGTYKYRSLLTFEESENIKTIPFMNNKHYIYDDLKYTLSRIKPISKYDPLFYIDEIAEDGISNLVNPLERRLC